jgi:hypothetical protein
MKITSIIHGNNAVMKRLQLLVLFLIPALVACKRELFVECEAFDEHGGWVVDPQFVEQMGSPYLMAHGLGIPVENARTTVQIPRSDVYHLWARTCDWAPGHWDAPGRFRLIVDNDTLSEVLGDMMSWGWNYAGKLHLPVGPVVVELEDLTGFNGRCDAIYLCNRYRTPTNHSVYLKEMRNLLTGNTDIPAQVRPYDLVVVGGGIAGCAASIAAAEQGLKVALVHDRPVLGGNASSEIRVHTLGIYGHFERILKMLDTEHYPNGSPEAFKDEDKRHRSMENYPQIELYLNYRAYRVEASENTIVAVDAKHTSSGEQVRLMAPYFVDCTGDGWIGYWAGAEFMYGREASGEYGETWDEYGELWSPSEPDNRVLGASLLWRSRESESASNFPEVPWAAEVAGNHAARNGTWQWEMISDEWNQVDNGEQIRDHMLKAIFGSFANEKKKPGNDKLELEWVSYLLGKRESRRLVGDYIYTFNDMRNGVSFPDSVVVEERQVDVHYRQDLLDESKPDFLAEAMYYKAPRYYVPYRALYSKNMNNLFMAGRCFSCSHIGLGGPRVMRTTGQMGAAVGLAAALCSKLDCSPRELYEIHLDAYMDLVLHSSDP